MSSVFIFLPVPVFIRSSSASTDQGDSATKSALSNLVRNLAPQPARGGITIDNLFVDGGIRDTHQILVRAEETRASVQQIFGWVAAGQTIHEITEKGGYF